MNINNIATIINEDHFNILVFDYILVLSYYLFVIRNENCSNNSLGTLNDYFQ